MRILATNNHKKQTVFLSSFSHLIFHYVPQLTSKVRRIHDAYAILDSLLGLTRACSDPEMTSPALPVAAFGISGSAVSNNHTVVVLEGELQPFPHQRNN